MRYPESTRLNIPAWDASRVTLVRIIKEPAWRGSTAASEAMAASAGVLRLVGWLSQLPIEVLQIVGQLIDAAD
jgi:hypothetical protein